LGRLSTRKKRIPEGWFPEGFQSLGARFENRIFTIRAGNFFGKKNLKIFFGKLSVEKNFEKFFSGLVSDEKVHEIIFAEG
jgi:hypothetical protein